jgi:hypothetical protein
MEVAGRIPPPGVVVQALFSAFSSRFAPHADNQPVQLARKRPYHVVFVSTNTRNHSTIEDALRELRGPRMQQIESETPGGRSGIGFWKDGAEESRMVPVGSPQAVAPTAATLGQRYQQKAVVGFSEDPAGTDIGHVLLVPERDPHKIHRDLFEKHGVEYKTILPGPGGTNQVHILDGDGGVSPSVQAYAKESGSRHRMIRGKITFIGSDTAEAATQEYSKHIDPIGV